MTCCKRNLVARGLALALLVGVSLTAANADQPKDSLQPIKNLQFQAAEIRSVFTFLADYGGVNAVVAPKVQGSVTIKLTDVKWREAMDIIGRTYDLAVVEETSGFIRVMPAEDYRKEVSEQRKHDVEQQQLVPLETKIVQISNSTSDDVVKAVKSLLTARGQATSDPRSNSIILQEVPTNIPTVLDYIAQLDKPARQIKISAQLLEINSNALTELGLKWDVNGTYTTSSGRSYNQTGEVIANRGSDVAGRYIVQAMQKGWTVDAVVEALVREGKGKIIAHPEITTIDNKEAKIQMGQKVPIKQFDDAGNVVIKFQEVGTILVVTPHITADNQILMHLKPERSTYAFDPNGVIINTNNAETNVIVANQQTAVIGGLTTQDELTSEVGVPILKDIPILGYLFKFKQTRTENRDLVIFVTPTIVDANLAAKN
jgi:type IV pilus assembly protein PilQ